MSALREAPTEVLLAGIPEGERRALRDAPDTDELTHCSGMGLWLVDWIVRQSVGWLHIGDADPRGTVVTIELPKEGARLPGAREPTRR